MFGSNPTGVVAPAEEDPMDGLTFTGESLWALDSPGLLEGTTLQLGMGMGMDSVIPIHDTMTMDLLTDEKHTGKLMSTITSKLYALYLSCLTYIYAYGNIWLHVNYLHPMYWDLSTLFFMA